MKDFPIHRLVCSEFLGQSTLDVNHIDGDKQNNNLNNLEWCTRSENVIHAYNNGLKIPTTRNTFSKINIEIAKDIKNQLITNKCSLVSKNTGVSIHIVRDIKRNRTWKDA